MATMTDHDALVTLGVDTHADIHVAAALDQVGKVLGTIVIPTTTAGFAQLLEWAGMFGTIDRVGVEGNRRLGCAADPLAGRQRAGGHRGRPRRPQGPPVQGQV